MYSGTGEGRREGALRSMTAQPVDPQQTPDTVAGTDPFEVIHLGQAVVIAREAAGQTSYTLFRRSSAGSAWPSEPPGRLRGPGDQSSGRLPARRPGRRPLDLRSRRQTAPTTPSLPARSLSARHYCAGSESVATRSCTGSLTTRSRSATSNASAPAELPPSARPHGSKLVRNRAHAGVQWDS